MLIVVECGTRKVAGHDQTLSPLYAVFPRQRGSRFGGKLLVAYVTTVTREKVRSRLDIRWVLI